MKGGRDNYTLLRSGCLLLAKVKKIERHGYWKEKQVGLVRTPAFWDMAFGQAA